MSTSLTTIGYSDHADRPWLRILQFVGIVALVYAASLIGEAIYSARMLWPLGRTPGISAPASMYMFWFIASVIEILIGVLVIVGAISLLHSGKQRLIYLGQWAVIIFWMIAFCIGTMLRSRSETISLLISSIFYGVQFNIFPVMVILILRALRTR